MKKVIEKLSVIDEYINRHSVQKREGLIKIRDIVRMVAPDALEVISYKMPAFKLNGILLWFAAHENHFGIYPYSKTIEYFKDRISKYETSKGTIRFPVDKPLPVKLITDIVKFRVKENLAKKIKKSK